MSDKKKTYKEIHGTTRVGDALRWLARTGKNIAPELLDLALNPSLNNLKQLGSAIKGHTELTEQDKIYLNAQIEMDKQELIQVSERWKSDMVSDSWLSKNIRPLALAFLTVITFIFVLLDSAIDGFIVKESWVSLLESLLIAVYLAYFGSRGVEKFKKISKQ